MSHEGPTRVMRTGDRGPRRPSDGREPDPQQIGRLRLVIACLAAVIVGLIIALLAGAGGGDGETTTVTETVEAQASEPTATTPTATTEEEQPSDSDGDSGGITPPVDETTDTGEATPDTGGETPPEPDTGDQTTPSGGISPDG